MNNRHDPHHILFQLVNKTITGVRNNLSSARDHADGADFGMLGYSGNRFSEAALHFDGRFWIYVVQVVPNFFTIMYSIFSPDNLHP